MKKTIQLLGGVNVAAFVAVLAILLIIFQFFFLDHKLRKEARSNSRHTALLASKDVTNSVQVYFHDAITLTNTYSGNFLIYKKNKIPRYSIYELIKGSLGQNNKFLAIWTMWEHNAYDHMDAYFANDSIHDAKGYMSISYYYLHGAIKRELNDTSDYNKDFYTVPRKKLRPTILDPFNYQYHGNPHSFLETSLVYPIVEKGIFQGVIGIDIDLEDLMHRYQKVKVYKTGSISILTNSGQIVTHNDSVYVGKNLKEYLSNIDLLDSMKQSKTFSFESISKINGQKSIRFFFPIDIDYLTTPWYSMVEIPEQEIFQFANSLRTVSSVMISFSITLLLYLIFNSIDRRKKMRVLSLALKRAETSEKGLIEANQTIAQNEQLLKAIFNQTFSFIGLTSTDGTLLKSNPTALHYINKKEEEVINQPFWETPWWNHSQKEQEKLKDAIKEAAQGKSIQTEVVHVDSSGKENTLLFSLKPVFNEQGDIIYLLPEGIDITSLKETEEQLKIYQLHLEEMVKERTEEYFCANEELMAVNEELQKYKENLEKLVEERTEEIKSLTGLFEKVLKNSSDAIFIIDVVGNEKFKYVRVNQIAEASLSIKNADLGKGKLIEELLKPELASYFITNYQQCLEKATPVNYRETLQTPDGESYWSTSLIPIKNKNSQIIRIVGFSRNITREIEISNALGRSEQKYRLLFEKIMSAFVLYEPVYKNGEVVDFTYIEVNPAFNNHSPYPAEYCIGKTQTEVYGNRENIERYIRVFNTGNSESFEAYYASNDRYLVIHVFKPEDNRLAILFQNITEQKKAEKDLRENEIKFRSIFNISPDAIYIGSYEGPFFEINQAAQSLSGYPLEEILQMNQLDFIPPKYHQLIRKRQELIKYNKDLEFIEVELIHKDGSLIPIELNSRNIQLGDTECRLTVVRDIRERKLLQRKLIDAIIKTEENERRRFAGDLHDELGPQLAAMRIYASSLKRRVTEPEQIALYNELMEMIKKAIINVREISANLSPHLLDTYGLVAAIDSEIENKRMFFSVQFDQNINDTRFEPNIETIVYRIVKELLNNTMKYAHATKVIISANYHRKELTLAYADNGIGFNYEELMLGTHKGIGLLNIQHRINSIQGSCVVQSQPGQGFSLTLEVPVLPLITN